MDNQATEPSSNALSTNEAGNLLADLILGPSGDGEEPEKKAAPEAVETDEPAADVGPEMVKIDIDGYEFTAAQAA